MVARNITNLKNSVQKIQGGGVQQAVLKKGPWTTEEDAILMDYIHKHGEGNWNTVQRNCGLSRCGKSCRLRWANHLRPDLKKGSFTPAEERFIIEFHAKIGNKWARMASQESNILADQILKLKKGNSFGDGKGKEICEELDSNFGPNLSPLHSSWGMKKEPIEGMNQLNDDPSSLLNNFPQSVPVLDWYGVTTTASVNTDKDYSSGIISGTTTSTNPKWGMGSSCWNNMPSIY